MNLKWIKYFFVILFISISLFCFKDFKQEISKEFVLQHIQLPFEKRIDDNKLTINKIDLSALDQSLIVNLQFDLDIKEKIKQKDIQAIAKVSHKIDFYDKNIYLKIEDFDILNTGTTESKSKIMNSLISVIKEPFIDTVNDKSAFISNLFNVLLQKPVYQLTGFKGFFLNNITIKETVDNFYFIVEFNTFPLSIPLIIISILLMLKEIGLFFIFIYQKFISPRKGYRCAKAFYQGGHSCSESVRIVMKEKGFLAGIKEYFRTTNECKEVFEQNKDTLNTRSDNCNCCSTNNKNNSNNNSFSCFDIADCSVSSCSPGRKGCDIGDCSPGGCDIGPC